jgi:hypothetical protein
MYYTFLQSQQDEQTHGPRYASVSMDKCVPRYSESDSLGITSLATGEVWHDPCDEYLRWIGELAEKADVKEKGLAERSVLEHVASVITINEGQVTDDQEVVSDEVGKSKGLDNDDVAEFVQEMWQSLFKS